MDHYFLLNSTLNNKDLKIMLKKKMKIKKLKKMIMLLMQNRKQLLNKFHNKRLRINTIMDFPLNYHQNILNWINNMK